MSRSISARLGSLSLRTLFLAAILVQACSGEVQSQMPAQAGEVQAAPAGAQQYVYPGAEWERIADPALAGYDAERLEAVRARIEGMDTTAMMVVVGGRVLFEHGDLTHVSYLASVRKSILAMLYGNYVADGTIDLTKTLEEIGMDDVGGLEPNERRAKVWHLVTARSGVYHQASNSGDDTALAPERGTQEPGTYYLYNNWDFNAAGGAFERLTGRNIYEALESDIAIPIGMRDFDRSRHRKSGNSRRSQYLAYHMNLSTRDMARVGYLALRGGEWEGRQVVPREWMRRITSVITPVEEMNPDGRRNGPHGYGYMWWVWDGPHASGAYRGAATGIGAYGQYITVLPALDMVIAHKTDPDHGRVNHPEFMEVVHMVVSARSGPTLARLRTIPGRTGPWYGEDPPEDEPRLFARDLVSTGLSERDLAASPDGRELYWTVYGAFPSTTIMTARETEAGWSLPQAAPFSGDPRYRDLEPFLSADAQRLYFASDRPDDGRGPARGDSDLWVVERTAEGWGAPSRLGPAVNSSEGEYFPSLTTAGTLYFTRTLSSGDDVIMRARPDGRGGFAAPEALPEQVNAGQGRYNALVDAQERFLILTIRGLQDDTGNGDYYIIFRDEQDRWSQPVNLGAHINTTSGQEYAPALSADGRYFFFMSLRPEQPADRYPGPITWGQLQDVQASPRNGLPDIWWVSARFLEDLRPR